MTRDRTGNAHDAVISPPKRWLEIVLLVLIGFAILCLAYLAVTDRPRSLPAKFRLVAVEGGERTKLLFNTQ